MRVLWVNLVRVSKVKQRKEQRMQTGIQLTHRDIYYTVEWYHPEHHSLDKAGRFTGHCRATELAWGYDQKVNTHETYKEACQSCIEGIDRYLDIYLDNECISLEAATKMLTSELYATDVNLHNSYIKLLKVQDAQSIEALQRFLNTLFRGLNNAYKRKI